MLRHAVLEVERERVRASVRDEVPELAEALGVRGHIQQAPPHGPRASC